ncbi:MAG: S8 family peptidase [Candidatus Hydrogenedentota bacterium]
MTNQRIIIILLLSCFAWIPTSHTQDAVAPDKDEATDFPSTRTYYYNGNSRVTVQIALDELHIESNAPVTNVQVLGDLRPVATNASKLRMRTPSRTLDDLKTVARGLSVGAQRAHATAYAPGILVRDEAASQTITNRIHLKPAEGTTVQSLASRHGFRILRSMVSDPEIVEVETLSRELLAGLELANTLHESGDVVFAQPVIQRSMDPRIIINDPQFEFQWNFLNQYDSSQFTPGNDINLVPAWDRSTGTDINILIVDSGVLNSHPDLAPNARTDIDVDYFEGGQDSSANTFHGTGVAGLAAAKGNNAEGIAGVAFDADIVGVRLIVGAITDTQIADALSHIVSEPVVANQSQISNNSWGPSDSSAAIKELLPPVVEFALADGVTTGRNGKGVIYVWAGGNGRNNNQDISFDGYAASRYTIAVGATGGAGLFSSYSEPGASLLVNAPSSFDNIGVVTTTINDAYTDSFSGTSASAPTVAGVVALMLDANPALGWRDVQHILVISSTKTNIADTGWHLNGGGFLFHHDYGYGRVNANIATKLAATWFPVPAPLATISGSQSALSLTIPDADATGITSTIDVVQSTPFAAEHVEVELTLNHTYRGDLNIILTSPSGMQSVFTTTHNDSADDYINYLFTSVAHWGEDPDGIWELTIFDGNPGNVGALQDWTLNIYGGVPLSTLNPAAAIPTLKVPFFETKATQPAKN